jgi:hypothetical protein
MKKTNRESANKRLHSIYRTKIAILIGVVAALALSLFFLTSKSSNTASAAPQKQFRATRPIIVDQQTGQRRMPTQEEIDQIVSNLSTLANRPEDLPQTTAERGGVSIDVQGGYGGVMLARPNADGTWETRCVFTLAEGAEFLGLVDENSAE